MTTPDFNGIMPFAIIATAKGTGSQFLWDKDDNFRFTLPPGLNQVQLTWQGRGSVRTQVRYPSRSASWEPAGLQIPSGDNERRTRVVDVPADSEGVGIDFTASGLTSADIGVTMLSARVIPLPLKQ